MIDITPDLVRALISAQFPDWSELPVRPVDRQGWDNRTFRLGDELTVRLPSAEGYAAAVAKEDRCLPALARHLSLPVPEPVAAGRPGRATRSRGRYGGGSPGTRSRSPWASTARDWPAISATS